ncbi:indole-3-glycerol phosphate synthase TrpC [Neobacillus sp. SM06]|uniref:indole-3-glycerol phosphate synthase TrpC n=1 Tax=Neobacillus sp. SM06 TaxID=3422492 RepID=UPI003D2D08D4
METILEKILNEKRKEVQLLKKKNGSTPQAKAEKRSLIKKLEEPEAFGIIAEFKRASPSKGVINNEANPVEQARKYEENGAAAISVLTDATFFKGSFADLKAVKTAVSLPVLCKDFIIDPVQIDAASANGADLILLIVAALDDNLLKELYNYAKKLGLEVLVEVHNEAEAKRAIQTGAKLIGVNNRDLKTFHVSLETVENVAPIIKESGSILISESGIHHREDVFRVKKAGANGIVVGEALMKSAKLGELLGSFRNLNVKEQVK